MYEARDVIVHRDKGIGDVSFHSIVAGSDVVCQKFRGLTTASAHAARVRCSGMYHTLGE